MPFLTRGSLENFSVIELLPKISAPTLIINGEFDMCQDICIKQYFYLVPRSKWIHLDGCSHMPFFEDRDRYMQIVHEFLISMA